MLRFGLRLIVQKHEYLDANVLSTGVYRYAAHWSLDVCVLTSFYECSTTHPIGIHSVFY